MPLRNAAMWARNLLFLGLVSTGIAGLVHGLYPRPLTSRLRASDIAPTDHLAVTYAIDRTFRQEWSSAGLHSVAPAEDLAIARRLSLALTGTIPALQEIRALEALPPDRRLDTFLASIFQDRRYADYLAERLARAYVGSEDGPFLIYRRRRFVTWLSDELFRNRPYDELVRDLIAGQGLWTDHPATNFVTVTYDPDKKEPAPERLAARVARAFLGVRLDCAQCHDHPFQPWKQADFQGLAAYFGQVHQGFTGTYDGGGEFEAARRKTTKPVVIEPHVPFQPELLPQDGSRREQLARWVTDPRNPYLARATANRIWALLMGRPLVEPVDDLASAGEPPAVLRLLADDFAEHGYDLRRLIAVIAATEVFRLDSAADPEPTPQHERHWAVFPLTRLRPEQVGGAVLQASSVETIDRGSHILTRIAFAGDENEFVKRYGDVGEDEFSCRPGTIPQRLLLMNGKTVYQRTEEGPFTAAGLIAGLAPTDQAAIETAYLTVLTRRPTPAEAAHFEHRLAGTQGGERHQRLSDLFWTLVNSTEFSWNH
jgi:hypothetical protein